MALIFATENDQAYDIEIQYVGVLGAFGKGGISVERAAAHMRELQDEDGEPLTGKKLEDAARKFADGRDGIKVRSIKNLDEDAEEKLRVEAGAFPRGLTAREVSERYAESVQAQVAAHQEAEGAPVLDADEVPVQATSNLPEPSNQEA